MSIHILLITQPELGQALLKAAEHVYGKLPLPVTPIEIKDDVDPTHLIPKLQRIIKKKIAENKQILVLTDLFGSTSANIATVLEQSDNKHIRAIAGINLPMLIKILNYEKLPLQELVNKAVAGGKDGVVCCSTER